MTNSPEVKKEKARGSELQEVFSFCKTLVFLLVAFFLLRATVVEAFKIPSGSMIPTLMIGDQILVTKFTYGIRIPFKAEALYTYSTPKHGEIVVFTRKDDSPFGDESEINIVKRVIGLPGDIVEVQGTTLYLNNMPYPEPYARWKEGGREDFPATEVPEGHLFLLGDNRDHSRDSRTWPEHFIDKKKVKGKAIIIYWSWDSLSRIGTIIR